MMCGDGATPANLLNYLGVSSQALLIGTTENNLCYSVFFCEPDGLSKCVLLNDFLTHVTTVLELITTGLAKTWYELNPKSNVCAFLILVFGFCCLGKNEIFKYFVIYSIQFH